MIVIVQELQQLLKHSQEQCTALGNYKNRFLALQQQHESLQGVCHQLYQDLGNARDELKAAQDTAQLQANYELKSPKAISMQANSTILDSCHDDDIHAHNARSQQMPVSQHEHQLEAAGAGTQGGVGKDALHLQRLADQLAELTLQQNMLSACPSILLYSLEDTLQHALMNTQRVTREVTSSELSQVEMTLKHAEQKLEDYKACPLCMEHDKEMVLSCGHQFCEMCCGTLTECPFCRTPISMRLRIFSA